MTEIVEKYGIGQAMPRVEDGRLLAGGGRYIDDITFPRMLFGAVLRSPHAHARIKGIDTRGAKQMPGVELVLTADDYERSGIQPLALVGPPVQNAKGVKTFLPRRGPLAKDKVRYVGDVVAFVVADTLANAKDACEQIEVEYEPLPAVTGTAEATEGTTIWEDRPDNIAFVHEAGNEADTEAGIAKAAHVIRQRLNISRVLVSSMESRGTVAYYDPQADFYTIHMGTQGVFAARADFARLMGEPESKFRVLAGDVGGSFGMKGVGYPEQLLPVWASRILGEPVKLVLDRTEACLSDNHGRDNVSDATLALDADGKFLAFKVETSASIGGYPGSLATGSPTNNIGTLAGVYTTPAIFVRIHGVYTNNAQTGPFRGAGRPEAAYVIERMVELAARKLNIDPVELRRRNMIPTITTPYKTALTFTYDSGDFEPIMDQALATIGYAGFPARREESAARGKLRGIGVATVIERAAPPGLESVEVRVGPNGTVLVHAGTTDQGQGHKTMYTQLICDRLGVDPGLIRVVEGDTEALAMGSGTGGSRVSAMGMSAGLIAVDKVIEKGRIIAAHKLEAAAQDIVFKNARFTISGTDRAISLADVAKAAHTPGALPADIPLGLAETGVFTSKVANYPNGCQICELEIDPEDGTVQILDYVVVDDVGTVINPLGVKGQIHGGVAMGVGQALMEQVIYDETGQLVTATFQDYAMPRADCFPEPKVFSHPVPTPTNPLGVKGVGEAGTVGALPATMNAVINALAPLGIEHVDMPCTPERLWRAIRDARVKEVM